MKKQTQKAVEEALKLLEKFDHAEAWRKQYDELAVECYKQYVGYREPLDEEHVGRSNLHIPRTYEQIDALRSRFLKSLFSSRPYIDFIPMPTHGEMVTPEEMLQREERGKIAAALLDMQFEKNGIIHKFYDYFTSLLVFPAGVLGVGWRYEEKAIKREVEVEQLIQTEMGPVPGAPLKEVREIQKVVWDDNEIVNIDYFDFWPDPHGQDVDSCRYVFQREWLTKEQIQARLELYDETGSGDVYAVDYERVQDAQPYEEGRFERVTAVGLSPNNNEDSTLEEADKNLFEILHYWEDGRHAMIINRQFLIFDGQNPYWMHGKKPFIAHSYEPLPNEFYGRSAVSIMKDLQAELDTLRNQRVDNISFVLNKMWKVRKSADIDESELVSRPQGIIHVDNDDDVTPFDMNDVTSSAFQDEAIIKQDMENCLGVPAVVRGTDPGRKETATEVVTKSSNASVKFDVKVLLFEELGIKRLAGMMDANNHQFITAPRLVNIFGQEGAKSWLEFSPEDDTGDYDYRPAGSSTDAGANRDYMRQQFNQLMSIIIPADIPWANKYELFRAWMASYDLRNVNKFVYSQEQLAQQQQLALQQMLMQQMAGGQQGQQGQQGANGGIPGRLSGGIGTRGEPGKPLPGPSTPGAAPGAPLMGGGG